MKNTAILLIDAPDQKGLVARISNFLYDRGANILHADQHRDNENSLFFMRIEWDLSDFQLDESAFVAEFQPLAESLALRWRVEYTLMPPKIVIFVSRYLHCLSDLLERRGSGELACEIPLVVSNHADAKPLVRFHGLRFEHIPVPFGGREKAEARQLQVLESVGADTIVLARYMQVLSPAFVARYPRQIINVHHSFLPAFSGARPYHAAFQRGVKLIGATSHYVTEVLDDGPIIEQDVTRVSHRDQLEDLIQKGRDVERLVLSRAVRWHVERRILQYANRTVVFD